MSREQRQLNIPIHLLDHPLPITAVSYTHLTLPTT